MIYCDVNHIYRIQNSSGKYTSSFYKDFIHNTQYPMHLEFPNNKPIGPTSLVEWQDD